MYVVLLNYTAPLAEIDYVLPDHNEWLARQFDQGLFLAAGRRNPRVGSVLLARPMSRGKLDALLATNPLLVHHLAHTEVIEFPATRTAPELRQLNEAVMS